MTLGQAAPLSGQHPGRKLLAYSKHKGPEKEKVLPLSITWFPVLLTKI
jgi:hypothetical protein